MAGFLSQAKKVTVNFLVESAMGPFLKELWPIIKYLVDRSVLIPLAAMGGIGYGVHLGYLTGPEAVWPIAIIAGVVIIARIITKYLGKKQEKGEPQ